jgi:DNA-binding NarL/FixJ family response regulator
MQSSVKSLRCLIVDDNAAFFAAATRLLESSGITIVGVAVNSAEALRCVAELRPDVTLVDVDLGAESGFDLAEQLRDTGTLVIVISACDESVFCEMATASGALGFIPKSHLSSHAIWDLVNAGDEADPQPR